MGTMPERLGRSRGRSRGVEMEITGAVEIQEIMEKLPSKITFKPVVSTLRKGARHFTRELRKQSPTGLKTVNKAIKVKNGKNKKFPSITAGFTGGKFFYVNRHGQKWDPYMLAYWSNYGTLGNRAGGHDFEFPRKSKSSHWDGGIKPKWFVEKAWEAAKGPAENTITEEFEKVFWQYLKKHAVQE